MSELIKELVKNTWRERDNVANIVEEIADVEIMLAQLKTCFDIAKDVQDYKKEKLKKVVEMLDKWENRQITQVCHCEEL